MQYDIQTQARKFLALVLPQNASPTQKTEMFKAFMAGYASAFDRMTSDMSDMSDEDAETALGDLERQLLEYAKSLQAEQQKKRAPWLH